MEMNIRALCTRAPESETLRRYETVARILTGKADASPGDGVEWVTELVRELQIPPLGSYGIQTSDIATLAEKASKASSMKANPLVLTAEELREVLTRAL
jgi:alcohol dehydrogenase class IV